MQVKRFVKVLEHYNTKSLMDTGGAYRARCPIHDGNNPTSFVVNKDNALWYCHTCALGGDVLEFIIKKENVSFPEAKKILANILGVEEASIKTQDKKGFIQESTKEWYEYNKKMKLENKEYEMPDIQLYNLKSYREFTANDLKDFGVKYAEEFPITNKAGKNSILPKRIVFPIYFEGVLIGVSLRRVNNKNIPKWLHQPTNIHTGSILYNYDRLTPFEPVGIVEGMLDVIKYSRLGINNVVATFGARLTEEQERLLIKKTDSIWLSYDNDKAGEKATAQAIGMLRNKANLRKIILPSGADPCDLTDEELLDTFNNIIKC